MDVFHSIQVFVSVIETGSFTKAAQALHLHRPAVSKTIQLLERQLGGRLLNRTTRQVNLTPDGEAFYERCKSLLADVSETMSSLGNRPARLIGKLRVDMPVSLAKLLIIPSLMDFQSLHPGIELTIGASDKPIDMLSEGVDCVVRMGELEDSSLIARSIGYLPMLTCAAPSYLERFGTPQTLTDLETHRAVNYFAGSNPRPIEWVFTVDGQMKGMRLESGIRVNDTEAFVASALAGFGLLQGLEISVRCHLQDGSLVQVLGDIAVPAKRVSILYPHREHLPPKVDAFIEWLKTLMATHHLA
ncbi:HTH-type transcriptional regulator PgrR [Pseudomonas fluorescens]|uniref:LysR family transcriptional regulator n=1 Tax=Pseudomonas fluorescens TaxID=294 RepID=UPI0012597D84|nr:LysR family transcriptional regulator [Pseudomonas fluorescens]CAG8867623.1 HTH-type transcriptional regulator PgrR [Pseudomonas fluorescens]VVQ06622.1 HTH-type transcriptional regulator PgrR [Pseudomonas fluorescens]